MPIISDNYPMKGLFQCPHITARCFFYSRILKITNGSNGKTGNNMLLPVCFHSCDGCHHPRFTLTPAITHSPGCFTAERS